jgi:hypothetical protein
MPEFGNQYREERTKSKGESEVEMGSLLLMAFKWLKVPMPKKADEEAVERAGQLLQRRFTWIASVAKKVAYGN